MTIEMCDKIKKDFKDKYINQVIKITTNNNRIFEGTFKAIDFRGNIILHNAIA